MPKHAAFQRLLAKVEEWLDKIEQVRYFAVPVWRPWRDF